MLLFSKKRQIHTLFYVFDVASYFVTLWICYYLIRIFCVYMYVTKLFLYYLHNHNYLFIANQYFRETDLYVFRLLFWIPFVYILYLLIFVHVTEFKQKKNMFKLNKKTILILHTVTFYWDRKVWANITDTCETAPTGTV